jgi:hypothetical protein
MFDEIFETIKNKNVIALCYLICKQFYESKQKLIHVFIELYAKYYSITINCQLMRGVIIRLSKLANETEQSKGCKLMVELFLLLYYSKINCLPNYEANKATHYEHHDLGVLINDSANKDICKDICFKSIKTKTQDKVTMNLKNIQDKNKNDYIWLVWFELMTMAKASTISTASVSGTASTSKDLLVWIKLQLDIFTSNYVKTQVKNRIYILYSIIDVINNPQQFLLTEEPIIRKSFLEIMFKIDYILQELGLVSRPTKRSYLNTLAMLQFPNVQEHKHEHQHQQYHPHKKTIQTSPSVSNKIYFDIITKQGTNGQ